MSAAPDFVWRHAEANCWAGVPERWIRHRVLRVSRLFVFVDRAGETGEASLFTRQQPPARLSRARLAQGYEAGYWGEPQLSEAYHWHATPWGYEGTKRPDEVQP